MICAKDKLKFSHLSEDLKHEHWKLIQVVQTDVQDWYSWCQRNFSTWHPVTLQLYVKDQSFAKNFGSDILLSHLDSSGFMIVG